MKNSNFTIIVADDDPDYLYQTISNRERSGYKTVAVESAPDVGSVFTVRLPKKLINIPE